ncbi:bifunctional diguanylate cyclase/phosphodiesterase [Synechococcus sp. PCC 6312]|uniref:putative bifunctional diguanylate cyclase/phosphodiesterase n=1 Tax=Synechococcus sp. (strain ATCC 27167 / PCC 6312) TaxID=195253 RepID=UPI00029ED017|nr:EAL domain-containing protein [Synechococcus sp. PCC 6312]AFY59387.1 EAL domain-containing protein [Synechococcus sp. PCC 6312]
MNTENIIILVIEDDENIRENIVEMLTDAGFQVLVAENGVSGLRIAQENHPNLILCDIMMPQLDGYGVLLALRQKPDTELIPFIFLTARADRTDQRIGMQLGADDYVTKPFSRADLLEAISTRLAKANSQEGYSDVKVAREREKLEQMYHYDPDSGLPNRFLLRRKFNETVATRNSLAELVGILTLQILQLRQVEMVLNPQERQQLILELTRRLRSQLGEKDVLFLMDHDRYLIIAAVPKTRGEIQSFVELIQEVMAQPIRIGTFRTRLSVQMGISCFPEDDIRLEGLVEKADLAASLASEDVTYEFYSSHHREENLEQLMMEDELLQALEDSWFRVFYQPKIDANTGAIVGAEALVRCQHPQKGLLPPAKFIPIAEATGLMVPIGLKVLEQVCLDQKQWHKLSLPPLKIAVNLSPLQFRQANLDQTIAQLLATHELLLSPNFLELEVTESCLIANVPRACEILTSLKTLGITIAIDDFGTGYSSLEYLQVLPVDVVKIDQCFVRDLETNPRNASIVKSVIQLCHELNLQVVAEGVETVAEVRFLQSLGCDQLQGYLFSRPVPEPQFYQFWLDWSASDAPELSQLLPVFADEAG